MAQTLDFAKIKAHLDGIADGFVDKEARIGWLEGVNYESGVPAAYVAVIQEFGSPENNIPPRPFLKPTIDKRKDAWVKLLTQGVKAVARGSYSANEVLEGVGVQVVGDIKKTISEVRSPPLAPSTIAARHSRRANGGKGGMTLDQPLNDTGFLIASVQSVVADAK